MRVQLLFALLSSTTLLATAIPQASITPPSSYYLQSHVVVGGADDDDGGNKKHGDQGGKDGLWVSCYQTVRTEKKKIHWRFIQAPFFLFPLSPPPESVRKSDSVYRSSRSVSKFGLT